MKKGTQLINKETGKKYTTTGNVKEMFNSKRIWEVIEVLSEDNSIQYISKEDLSFEILKEENSPMGSLIEEIKGIEGILVGGNSKCEDIIISKGATQLNINYTNGTFTTIIKDLTEGVTDYAGKKKHKTYKGLSKFIKSI